jgi:hypothetical protein
MTEQLLAYRRAIIPRRARAAPTSDQPGMERRPVTLPRQTEQRINGAVSRLCGSSRMTPESGRRLRS